MRSVQQFVHDEIRNDYCCTRYANRENKNKIKEKLKKWEKMKWTKHEKKTKATMNDMRAQSMHPFQWRRQFDYLPNWYGHIRFSFSHCFPDENQRKILNKFFVDFSILIWCHFESNAPLVNKEINLTNIKQQAKTFNDLMMSEE